MNDGELQQRLQAALADAYTLERELGGGGMSRVFLATERALGRRVVVKVLPPQLAEGLSAERFTREIRVAARLQHPHIVPLLSAGEADGLPWFTMPYVEGESLRARLSRAGELPISEAVRTLREVASGDSAIVHFTRTTRSTGPANAGHLGVALALRGDTARARAIADSLGALRRKWLFGSHIYWQAQILAALGEKEAAVRLLQQAFAAGQGRAGLHYALTLRSLRGYAPFEALLQPQ